MMTDAILPGAVLFVRDMERVARFYEALLDMDRTEQVPTAIVLRAGGFELIVHVIVAEGMDTAPGADPPPRRALSAHKLVFPVADLVAARLRAPALGGLIDSPEEEWCWGGFRACDGQDPEGNVFQLRMPEA